MQQLTVPAPAKLNLFLHITGRRADGYHELQTLFQLLDYGDSLHVRLREDGRLVLDSHRIDIAPADNLVLKAALLLQRHTGTQLGADIVLEKRLPVGGGVGGGSSDAASTLLALNALWQTGLDLPQLAELGLPATVGVAATLLPDCRAAGSGVHGPRFLRRAIDTFHFSHQNSGLSRAGGSQ